MSFVAALFVSQLLSTSATANQVETAVVGAHGDVLSPQVVNAQQTRIQVTKRKKCTVAANTPLAALLAATKQTSPQIRVKVKDYGSCGRRVRDSGQLFVRQVGNERNQGRNGWVYKVDNRVGSSGAADTAGPFGDNKLLSQQNQLLWFWCIAGKDGSCQSTLTVQAITILAVGDSLLGKVNAWNDQGKPTGLTGAHVTLTVQGVTNAQPIVDIPIDTTGSFTIDTTTLSPGKYLVRAFQPGAVPSFPQQVEVRSV